MHVQPLRSSGAKDPNFCSLPQCPFFMCISSEGSDETARMHWLSISSEGSDETARIH